VAYLYSVDRAKPGSYHVWGRARDGIRLFRDDEDRATFEGLIARYLSKVPHFDARGNPYVQLRDEVRACAGNQLTTHYHLIAWQKLPGGIDNLMRRVIHAYTRYYHSKYGTSGSLFPGPYRARRIIGRKSLKWRIAYVQKNHKELGLDWKFSTHRYFNGDGGPDWLEVDATLDVFGGLDDYLEYMEKFELRAELDEELRID
jgi:hypothetical protein